MKIEIKDFTKYYGNFCAVNNVSFSFESGKLTALVGRNGSGKTTTIRSMLGLIKRNSGNIIINGKQEELDVKKIGYLAEDRGLFQKEIVKDQLLFFGKLKGLSSKEAFKSIKKWMEHLEIEEHLNKKLESLSKGNQQKVQMVATLVNNPEIIICDEPFSGLDPVNMQMILNLFKELRNDGKCLLISSHQLALIEEVCENICIIDKSKLIYSGTLQGLKTEYGADYIKFSINDKNNIPKDFDAEEIAPLNYRIKIESNQKEYFNNILQKIADYNLSLTSVERSQKSLQDIFVELVGNEEQIDCINK